MAPETEGDTLDDGRPEDTPDLVPLRAHLFVVFECDRPATGGARYSLMDVDEIIIGRGEERSVVRRTVGGMRRLELRMPGRSMSSTHARIQRGLSGWMLQDARSTNGCSINGRRIDRTFVLHEGDVIELGHTIFLLEGALPTPPGTALDFESLRISSDEADLTTLNPELTAQFSTLVRVAQSHLPVLLLGETGTGKEVVARAIHRLSRRSGSFVAVNCGAIPVPLLESQLFGHMRGAFTGATQNEIGFMRAAETGTLLLDEVGDLPLSAQPALLRALQEREVLAVGSTRPVRIDVRVIGATHHSLDALVEQERFRHDLLARLDGYRIELPTLGRRRMDIGCLIGSVLRAENLAAQFSPEAGVELVMNPWKSNIRALVAAIRRAIVLADGQIIRPCHLNLPLSTPFSRSAAIVTGSTRRLHAHDRIKEELLARLQDSNGNIAKVARDLGKSRMQVHRWMKRYGIDIEPFRANAVDGEN